MEGFFFLNSFIINILQSRNSVVASVPGLADLLALQSRSADNDDDLDSLASSAASASSSVTSGVKKRTSLRLSTVKPTSYSAESANDGMLSDGNEDADDEDQENDKLKATGKGQKKGKKAPSTTLQTKAVISKKPRNAKAVATTSKGGNLEAENRNPEQVNTSRRVEYI